MTRPAAFLLAGAAITILVAWACALWMPVTLNSGAFQTNLGGKPVLPHVALGPVAPYADPEWFVEGNHIPYLMRHSIAGYGFHLWEGATATDGVQLWEAGWPLAALHAIGRSFGSGSPPSPSVWVGGLFLPDGIPVRARADLSRQMRAPRPPIPLRPSPLGFAVDTLLYAALLWLVINGWGRLRRWNRRRRGRCESCGYDLTGLPAGPCPECGSAVPVRVQPAAAPFPDPGKPAQPLLRRVASVICLLLAGAIMTVMVAWVATLWVPLPEYDRFKQMPHTVPPAQWGLGPALACTDPQWLETGPNIELRPNGDIGRGFGVCDRMVWLNRIENGSGRTGVARLWRAGWPLPALRCFGARRYEQHPAAHNDPPFEWHRGFPAPDWNRAFHCASGSHNLGLGATNRLTNYGADPVPLPLDPEPLGFAADTLFYAALLALALRQGPGLVRSFLSRRSCAEQKSPGAH